MYAYIPFTYSCMSRFPVGGFRGQKKECVTAKAHSNNNHKQKQTNKKETKEAPGDVVASADQNVVRLDVSVDNSTPRFARRADGHFLPQVSLRSPDVSLKTSPLHRNSPREMRGNPIFKTTKKGFIHHPHFRLQGFMLLCVSLRKMQQ